MNRIGVARARGLEDPVDAEIALASRRRADHHGPIGVPDMERLAVGLGEDGDGPEAQPPAGAERAPCDLPPIRNQDGTNQ